MADRRQKIPDVDPAEFGEFVRNAVIAARDLKSRDDLLELAEIELQRSVATVARFRRARDRLLALPTDHPDAAAVIADVEATDRASREPRLYAITLLLPENQAQALLDRYIATADALPKGGRPAIV